MDWVISWANEREGYFTEIMVIWERSGDFQELGHCSLFDLWWLVSELSGCLWVYYLANVLQGVYNEGQSLLEVKFSTILDPVVSSQFCRAF